MTPLITYTLIVAAVICVPGTTQTVTTNARDKALNRNTLTRMGYFDQELFQAVTDEFKGQNLVVSPITVRLLLTMLMEGSQGLAREQIQRALRLTSDVEITRKHMKKFLAARNIVDNDEDVESVLLDMSARVFVASGQSVNQDYAKVLRHHYSSDVEKINITDHDEAAEVINSWVNRTTKGMIPSIITADQVNSDTAAVLASAVYFEGSWRKPFEDSSSGCFYRIKDKCTDTVFMRQNDYYQYADVKSLNAEVIELSYSQPRFSMLIMVPRDDVRDLLRDLPHVSINSVIDELDTKQVNLSVPRFTAENGQDITNILRSLQVTEAFSPTAIFNAIETKSNMTYRVDSVFHSSKVIVNERGTIAAAAATLQIRPNMSADFENVTVTVDKPFVFFIRDSATRMVLFAGVVTHPDGGDEGSSDASEDEEISTTTEATSEPSPIMNKVETEHNFTSLYTSPPPVYRNATARPNATDIDSEEIYLL